MGKSTPPPPAPPDYAAANRAGIETDIATLPQRRLIEAQARLGQGDFAGLGDAELAAQMFDQQMAQAPRATEQLLDLQRRFGGDFANEARRQLAITDPEGFALRQQFGGDLLRGDRSIEGMLGQLPDAPTYERVGDYKNADTGQAAAGRAALESQIFDELARAGTPDAALTRAAEQAARARGSASGNILGDGAALQESLGVQLANRSLDDSRRQNALSLLQSGQTTSDTQNRIGQGNFENVMAAIGQRNQAAQNQFGAAQANVQQRQGARQQDLANIQSFLGLTPIVAQGGQLQGLQQGAAPFVQNGYGGVNINQGAGTQGAEWAGQLYGAQMQQNAGLAQAAAAGNAGGLTAFGSLAGAGIIAA